MKKLTAILYQKLKKSLNNKKSVVAIGNFDGVHIGHRRILYKTVSIAKKENIESIAITFYPHPKTLFSKKPFPLIQNLEQRINLIKKIGIDRVEIIEFNKDFSNFKPEEFIKFLKNKFSPLYIVVGEEFRFGKEKKGDVKLLKSFSKNLGIKVSPVKKVLLYGEKVSSSIIKDYLLEGNLQRARLLLGGFYSYTGKVVKGKSLGKLLGYPTANIIPDFNFLLPNGIYITRTKVKNSFYNSITYVGNSPTLKKGNTFIETHIFNLKDEIYKDYVEIFFIDFLREEKKFKNKKELIEQIKFDIEYVKNLFSFL